MLRSRLSLLTCWLRAFLFAEGRLLNIARMSGPAGTGKDNIASLTPRQGAGVRQDAGEGGRSGRRGWDGQSGDACAWEEE